MDHTEITELLEGLSLFDMVILYRRALLGESYTALGKKLGFSYEYVRTTYSDIIKHLRKR